ncbi:MAG: proteasome assembly chaperone family protein [Candidatus Methanomethylophilaceae archaeon]|nr:proteasome assembly chaperone family protein [Candidatus Methanomethylophilaceae archaeon]
MDIDIIPYQDVTLNDPVAVIGFPSVGLSSSIMANMYIKSLDMIPVAGMASPSMPPYCLISDCTAMPPVRFYAYKNKRKNSHDVLLCMTEFAPKPEDCYQLCNKILSYMRAKGCRTIISMEGTPKFDNSKILAIAAGPNGDKLLKKCKIDPMSEGMIRGITGVMMYAAPSKGMDIISIMVPATSGVPDPGSAALFIDPIARLVPGFKTSPKELMKEAALIENQIEEAQNNMNETSQYIG